MSKITTVIISIFAVLLIAVSANASGLKLSNDYSMHDCVLVSGINSAGVCIGTLAEVKNSTGTKMIGLGGFTVAANEKKNLEVGLSAFTFFNDMLWVGAKFDTEGLKFNNIADKTSVSFGIVVSDAIRKLIQ